MNRDDVLGRVRLKLEQCHGLLTTCIDLLWAQAQRDDEPDGDFARLAQACDRARIAVDTGPIEAARKMIAAHGVSQAG